MDMVRDARDGLYLWEARAVQSWQQWKGLENILLSVSSWGDPSQGFIFYFPIVISLSYHRGLRFLGAFIVSEWLNMVCKWLLHGDRPYWWVTHTHQDLELIQTRLTCETGPGLPSGHSQAAAVIWFATIHTFTSKLGIPKVIGWIVFITMQVLMLLSRTYIGAHFPHQCIFGFLSGLLVVRLVYMNPSWLEWSRLRLVLLSVCLPVSSLSVFAFLRQMGFDPNWSIILAKKYCLHSDWIYVDTTPFYAMVRFSGSALGLALALSSNSFLQDNPDSFKPSSSLMCLLVTLSLGKLCSTLHAWSPRDDLNKFYTLEFLLNFFSVITIVKTAVIFLKTPNTVKKIDSDELKIR